MESLIVAKGYADCVAFMGEGGISIVVSAAEDGLQTEDVAKITDIVLSETDYTADQITIMGGQLTVRFVGPFGAPLHPRFASPVPANGTDGPRFAHRRAEKPFSRIGTMLFDGL